MNKKGLLPPAYFLIFLLLAIVLHVILPVIKFIHYPYNYAGILFIGIGIWLNLWADRLFKEKDTTVKPFEKTTSFIREGPFRFTRHPMYLGMVLMLLGVAVLLGSASPFICVSGFFIAMKVLFIPQEEKMLGEFFKQEFIDYKKRIKH